VIRAKLFPEANVEEKPFIKFSYACEHNIIIQTQKKTFPSFSPFLRGRGKRTLQIAFETVFEMSAIITHVVSYQNLSARVVYMKDDMFGFSCGFSLQKALNCKTPTNEFSAKLFVSFKFWKSEKIT
jgi:hypothetical protein